MLRFQRHMALRAMLLVSLLMSESLLTGCGKQTYEDFVWDEEENRTVSEADEVIFDSSGNIHYDIMVYICGAVKNPGVYTVDVDCRLCDVVDAAGGLLPDADEKSLNLAEIVWDGEQIIVPTKEETAAGISYSSFDITEGPEDQKVNINTADAPVLMTLKGIGESKAADIISYREKYGKFQTIEDIMKVTGIKTSLFEKIRDDITVG